MESALQSRNMCPLRLHIDGVERLAGSHEKAVALLSAETKIGADFRQQDHPDTLAVRREGMYAVIAFTRPAGGRPNISIGVGPDAIGAAEPAVQFHRTKAAFVL